MKELRSTRLATVLRAALRQTTKQMLLDETAGMSLGMDSPACCVDGGDLDYAMRTRLIRVV